MSDRLHNLKIKYNLRKEQEKRELKEKITSELEDRYFTLEGTFCRNIYSDKKYDMNNSSGTGDLTQNSNATESSTRSYFCLGASSIANYVYKFSL